MKDYYAVLGVLPSIEQSALKAVYAALMKKYHPDVATIPKQEAELRAKEINEAYSVLGDPIKRAGYDAKRKQSSSQSGDYNEESSNSDAGEDLDPQLQKDWQIVVAYFPEAEECRVRLRKISVPLSETFRILIISEKMARQAKEISELLQKEFLKTYFGSNEKLHPFVLSLIQSNSKAALLEINNYIRVIGVPPDNGVANLIDAIKNKFNISAKARKKIWKENVKLVSAALMDRRRIGLWGSGAYKIYLGVFADKSAIGWNPISTRYELFADIDVFYKTTKISDKLFAPIQGDSERNEFFNIVEHLFDEDT